MRHNTHNEQGGPRPYVGCVERKHAIKVGEVELSEFLDLLLDVGSVLLRNGSQSLVFLQFNAFHNVLLGPHAAAKK
jgi:hypothetical protein